jgi:hypothetical protein
MCSNIEEWKMMESEIFGKRKSYTDRVVQQVEQSLRTEFGDEHDSLIGDHTCIYATGSCGRGEMGVGSDLDAYVVRVTDHVSSAETMKAAVMRANHAAGLPALDNEGRYLEMVSANQILDLLGSPRDDSEGVLTKRILLLLESRVLLGEAAHQILVDRVIDAYWTNERLHPRDYLPYMLVNDIVRYWRIVLLNHESKLRKHEIEIGRAGEISVAQRDAIMLAERRYRSYKLRLPRCLTCFSALTYFLALTPTEPAHVSKDDVRHMIKLTPVERLRQLPGMVGRDLPKVRELLDVYRCYLERTNVSKQQLTHQLLHDDQVQQDVPREGRKFTELMFQLVQELGGGRPLHRHMLV